MHFLYDLKPFSIKLITIFCLLFKLRVEDAAGKIPTSVNLVYDRELKKKEQDDV